MMAGKVILAGKILTPKEEILDGVILIQGHRIASVGPRSQIKLPAGVAVVDYRDRTLVPGFIDIHIHGAAGHDLMEGTAESVSAVATHLARHGTTAFLATTVTAKMDRTLCSIEGLAKIITAAQSSRGRSGASVGAEPLGIHFEGPFLNTKTRGAHPAMHILKPSIEAFTQMLDRAQGTARIVTLAPELEGALALLEFAKSRGVRAGLGHSNATFEETERAVDAGATHAVHCFNAMRPFSHHDPGIIGAVLTDDRLSAELIADGVHVEPSAAKLLVRAKGLDRIILVTDSVSAASMPDGTYHVGTSTVRVEGGVCRTKDGKLAGGTTTLHAGIRNLARFTGASLAECVPCATLNPARILGLAGRKGVIAAGADADLVALDADAGVTQTYVRGQAVL
jgi:N-acetylglucosamine-6-phosphate deacetylase